MRCRLAPLVLLVACAQSRPPPKRPSIDVTTVPTPPASEAPPASERDVFAAETSCAANEVCPIDPPLPEIYDLTFDAKGRACLVGVDRSGCLGERGWQLHVAEGNPPEETPLRATRDPPPDECNTAVHDTFRLPLGGERGDLLFWSFEGERFHVANGRCRELPKVALPVEVTIDEIPDLVARAPDDVWLWTRKEIAHFDGRRWSRTATAQRCSTENIEDAGRVVAADGAIWFLRCGSAGNGVVRLDPKTRAVRQLGVTGARALALSGAEVVVTTERLDEQSGAKRFERHAFDLEGRPRSVEAGDLLTLRAAFDDGVSFHAELANTREILRKKGTASTRLVMPGELRALYAPSSHDLWAGGQHLYRWHDGVVSKVAYRPGQPGTGDITRIAGSSANDVWVASAVEGDNGLEYRLSHWDGKTWNTQADLKDEHWLADLDVVGPSEAWLTTTTHLYRWDGKAWARAGSFPEHHGRSLAVTSGAVWILGNGTIYRRSR